MIQLRNELKLKSLDEKPKFYTLVWTKKIIQRYLWALDAIWMKMRMINMLIKRLIGV